ncbi:hypothetical protein ACJX0J_007200, partial [Zea mays]
SVLHEGNPVYNSLALYSTATHFLDFKALHKFQYFKKVGYFVHFFAPYSQVSRRGRDKYPYLLKMIYEGANYTLFINLAITLAKVLYMLNFRVGQIMILGPKHDGIYNITSIIQLLSGRASLMIGDGLIDFQTEAAIGGSSIGAQIQRAQQVEATLKNNKRSSEVSFVGVDRGGMFRIKGLTLM